MRDRQPNAYHSLPDQIPPAPVACPVDRQFSPLLSGYLQNPYPELQKLNAERPIFYSTELQSLVVTRMDQMSRYRPAREFS